MACVQDELVAETKHDVLLRDCEHFYGPDELEALRILLARPTGISLRVFDWLVTNYSKKNNIVYHWMVDDEEVTFNMHLQYKMCLKGYQKRFFDPFRRRNRIKFNGLKTTVGQLNFFKWALTYGVVDYTRAHFDEIEADMLRSTQHRTVGKRKGRGPVRSPASSATSGSATRSPVRCAPSPAPSPEHSPAKCLAPVVNREDLEDLVDLEGQRGERASGDLAYEVSGKLGTLHGTVHGVCGLHATLAALEKTMRCPRKRKSSPVHGKPGKHGKRKQLSEAALKSCTTTHVQVLLKFS